MAYRIDQSEKYIGRDYWNWSAWIEASSEELDELDSVTWILHPTFSPSRIENRSRETKFRLDSAGWGTFVLRAQLNFKGQTDSRTISRMLKLTYPDNEGPETAQDAPRSSLRFNKTAAGNPTIYLSYSSEDERQAQQVRMNLKEIGAEVVDARSISAGLPVEAAVRKMIRESDAVMSVLGSDYTSPNVVAEMKMAKLEQKPIVAVLPEGVQAAAKLFTDVEQLRLGGDSTAVNSQLARFIGRLSSDPAEKA
jgi:transcription initiation factor IIF auxiliary subunit